MNRSEFILVAALVLFVAFLFGWFAYWLLHRLTRVSAADIGQIERMAQELHDAEEARDQAITWFQNRESELTRQLQQTEAELRATMEGLREARAEAEEMRLWIERQKQRG
jgi:prophage endopeptidase